MKSRSKETQKMLLGSLSCWTKQESISTPEPPSSGVPFGRIFPLPLLKKLDFDLMTLNRSLNGQSRPNSAHRADATWLDEECAKIRTEEPDRRIIVLTHYAPAMSGTSAPRHENQSANIRTAFATDMSSRSCWEPPVKVWAFGHTHFCCDFMMNNVRILSNQRGYEGIETRNSSFRDDFVLYI